MERDDDVTHVGPAGQVIRKRLGPFAGEIDPNFPHRLDHRRMHLLGWAGTGRPRFMPAVRRPLKERLAHWRSPCILVAHEQHPCHGGLDEHVE